MPPSPPLPTPARGTDTPVLVSVVLPVFNGATHIEAAVRSALAQTGVSFEVVVVDDGSTDGTAQVLDAIATDQRVRVIRLPHNMGLVHALNRGLSEARGELIARLDADDIALPGRLAGQAAVFADEPAVVLTACAYERVLVSGEMLRRPVPPLTHGALAMAAAIGGNQLCHSAVMFRRQAALDVGGYRPEWYRVEDFDLWLRLMEVGRYLGTSFVGTRYLVNPDGISQQHEQHQTTLARQRSGEFTTSLLGAAQPLPGGVRSQLRQLDAVRVALHRRFGLTGTPADGVDATAYRLALDAAGTGSPVARHLRVCTAVPALWRAGRQERAA